MFEQMTYEALLADVLNGAPENVDTRQGSIFYDAVSGICIKIAKLYTDLDLVLQMTSVLTATGDALDLRAGEHGIDRLQATKAKYKVEFEGKAPKIGERFYTDGQYFILVQDDSGTYYLEAETAGTSGNGIYEGTNVVPVNTVEGLESAEIKGIYENGTDAESDESLRQRVLEKISGPAENGNRQHYKTWCESIDGIGRARIYPLWNGENTVKAVLIDGVGKPCSEEKAKEVQKYIDPADKGMTVVKNGKTYTVGDGLGNGVANIGAHFTAVAASPITVNVRFEAQLRTGSNEETAKEEAEAAIEAHFRETVLGASSAEDTIVRVSQIGAIIAGLKSVIDYSGLTLNGAKDNIESGEDDVPVLGTVEVVKEA